MLPAAHPYQAVIDELVRTLPELQRLNSNGPVYWVTWDENCLPYKEPLTGIQKLDIKALCVCCVNRLPTLQKHFLMQTNNV